MRVALCSLLLLAAASALVPAVPAAPAAAVERAVQQRGQGSATQRPADGSGPPGAPAAAPPRKYAAGAAGGALDDVQARHGPSMRQDNNNNKRENTVVDDNQAHGAGDKNRSGDATPAALLAARGSLTPPNASALFAAAPPPSGSTASAEAAPVPSNKLIQATGLAGGDPPTTPTTPATTSRFSTRAFIFTSRKGRILRTIRATRAPPWQRAQQHAVNATGAVIGDALAEAYDVIRWPTEPASPASPAPSDSTDGVAAADAALGGEHPQAFQELGQQRAGVAPVAGLAEPPPEVAVIKFREVPGGDAYQLSHLDIGEGSDAFGYLSAFLSYVQPNDFPLDLLSDVLRKRVPLESVVLQALQVEAGFVSLSALYVLLALVSPCVCLCYACARICAAADAGHDADRRRAAAAAASGGGQQGAKHRRAAASQGSPPDTPPATPPPAAAPPPTLPNMPQLAQLDVWDRRDGGGDPCQQRSLLALLTAVLVALLLSVCAQLATNQQVSVAVSSAPVVVQAALGDVDVFVRNARLQIDSLMAGTFRQAVLACRQDLNNVDQLLGRPLQRELAAETGLDVALDALVDVASASQAVTARVQQLLEAASEATEAAAQVHERLRELRGHVDALKRTCPRQEKPLCDTLHTAGLHVTLGLEAVLSDARLAALQSLGSRNLSWVAERARAEFQAVPELVAEHTASARQGVVDALDARLESMTTLLQPLDGISDRLSLDLATARARALELTDMANQYDTWRWTAGVGASMLVMLPTVLLLGSATCLCCGPGERAGAPLLSSVVLVGLVSAPLWLASLAVLLVAGHAEVFVCRALKSGPDYAALSRALDPYTLSQLLYPNRSVSLPIKDVLRGCRYDGGAYSVLGLRWATDLEDATDPSSWPEVERQLARLRPDLQHLQLLTPELQADLKALLDASMANLTAHRLQVAGGVTGSDLSALADQMESVANQIGDVATASRVETLATRTRRVLATQVQPLAAKKENLVYQLTTLEVELAPLQRHVNQSLSHLKTIQYFVDKQGATMADQKANQFRARVRGYLQQARDHVVSGLRARVARCGPLWSSFDALSTLLCRHAMDPLNGLWASLTLSMLLLMAATAPALRLARAPGSSRHRVTVGSTSAPDGW